MNEGAKTALLALLAVVVHIEAIYIVMLYIERKRERILKGKK